MLNNVILMGRVACDIELRTTTSGKSVATFRIAVDRSFSKNGNKETDFITIVAWGNTADFVSKWYKKGDMIAIRGEIQTRNYEDKNGNKRTAFEVVAREVSFCGSKNESTPIAAGTDLNQLSAQGTYVMPVPDYEEIEDDDVFPPF